LIKLEKKITFWCKIGMDKIKKGYFVTTFASETPFHPKIEIFLAPLVGQIFQDNGIVHPNLNKLTRADARKKLIPHYSNVSSVLEKAFNLKINFNKRLKFHKENPLYLTPKGIGCFISHYFVWEKISAFTDGVYLVIEDKAYKKDVFYTLKNYNTSLTVMDGMLKADPDDRCSKGKNAIVNINTRGGNGTESYLMTPSAARILVKYFRGGWNWQSEVDAFLFRGNIRNPIYNPKSFEDLNIGFDGGWIRYVKPTVVGNFGGDHQKALSKVQPPHPTLPMTRQIWNSQYSSPPRNPHLK